MPNWVVVGLVLIALVLAGGASLSSTAIQAPGLAGAQTALDPVLFAEGTHANSKEAEPALRSAGTLRVPILVYHVVRPSYRSDSAAVRAIAQTPEVFDQEMAQLASAGYHVIPFADLESALLSGTPLPPKPVVLTFDDGWRDQVTYAVPVLEKYHYTATFFIFTNSVGHADFMTWDNLHELIAGGMRIGAHSRSHPYLTRLPLAREQDEIAGSKALLEERLGVPITEFAYPFGMHDATTTALVQAAGYIAARGDYYTGAQSLEKRYYLSAMNAPTDLAEFDKWFP